MQQEALQIEVLYNNKHFVNKPTQMHETHGVYLKVPLITIS